MKILIKIIISIVVTTMLYLHMVNIRGYYNPGGELLVIPLYYMTKYLYKELKEHFKREMEDLNEK